MVVVVQGRQVVEEVEVRVEEWPLGYKYRAAVTAVTGVASSRDSRWIDLADKDRARVWPAECVPPGWARLCRRRHARVI